MERYLALSIFIFISVPKSRKYLILLPFCIHSRKVCRAGALGRPGLGWGGPEYELPCPGPGPGLEGGAGCLVTSSIRAASRAGPERDSAAGGPRLACGETKLREVAAALAAAGPGLVAAATAA